MCLRGLARWTWIEPRDELADTIRRTFRAHVRALLQSDSPRDRRVGVQLAGSSMDLELIPDLRLVEEHDDHVAEVIVNGVAEARHVNRDAAKVAIQRITQAVRAREEAAGRVERASAERAERIGELETLIAEAPRKIGLCESKMKDALNDDDRETWQRMRDVRVRNLRKHEAELAALRQEME